MRYVYVIRNLINGKVYVGQTASPSQRKATHFYNARKGVARPLYASMRKHGIDNFAFEVLEECADEAINDREQHWVSHFDSFNPEKGYNLTSGGNQNFERSEETRMKIGAFWRGRRQSNEHVQNRVTSFKAGGKKLGQRPWNAGMSPSIETRQRISESRKGYAAWNKGQQRVTLRNCAICDRGFKVCRANRTHQTCGTDCRRKLISQKLMGNQNHRGND
jgi:group I intron endonuclease